MAKKIWTVEEIVHDVNDFRRIKCANIVAVTKSKKKAKKAANNAVVERFAGFDMDDIYWRTIDGEDVCSLIFSAEEYAAEYIICSW